MSKGIRYPRAVTTRFTEEQYKQLCELVGGRADTELGAVVREIVVRHLGLPRPPWQLIAELILAQNRWLYKLHRSYLLASKGQPLAAPFTPEKLDEIYGSAFHDSESMMLEYLDSLRQISRLDQERVEGGEID
jgi:hypothetical protein